VLVSAICETCSPTAALLQRRPDGRWAQLGGPLTEEAGPTESVDARMLASGRIEIREVSKRQVFLDGKPVSAIFD
jgi:hypothetical protein